MSTKQQTIAFFGATGGTAGASLAHCLRNGYHCTALARTPQKLRDFMTNEHNIPVSTLTSQLTIHQGDAKDPQFARNALISPLNSSALVDTIYTGIGTYGHLQASLRTPIGMSDPTICEGGMKAIFAAIDQLASSGITTTTSHTKPLVIMISTTGVSNKARDVPLSLYPLYHWGLQVPHEDKKKAEQLLFNDNGAHIRNYVIIRPTLLMDNEPKGLDMVKSGWEWGNKTGQEPGPQLGWTVGRKDVGEWVFRNVIVQGGWEGKCASLSY